MPSVYSNGRNGIPTSTKAKWLEILHKNIKQWPSTTNSDEMKTFDQKMETGRQRYNKIATESAFRASYMVDKAALIILAFIAFMLAVKILRLLFSTCKRTSVYKISKSEKADAQSEESTSLLATSKPSLTTIHKTETHPTTAYSFKDVSTRAPSTKKVSVTSKSSRYFQKDKIMTSFRNLAQEIEETFILDQSYPELLPHEISVIHKDETICGAIPLSKAIVYEVPSKSDSTLVMGIPESEIKKIRKKDSEVTEKKKSYLRETKKSDLHELAEEMMDKEIERKLTGSQEIRKASEKETRKTELLEKVMPAQEIKKTESVDKKKSKIYEEKSDIQVSDTEAKDSQKLDEINMPKEAKSESPSEDEIDEAEEEEDQHSERGKQPSFFSKLLHPFSMCIKRGKKKEEKSISDEDETSSQEEEEEDDDDDDDDDDEDDSDATSLKKKRKAK